MKKKKYDPIFLKEFKVKTYIKYIPDVIIPKKSEKHFKACYRRFLKTHRMDIAPTRKKQLKSMITYLQTHKTDEKYRERVLIRWISPSMGYGVYATEDIPPYTLLTHYAGIFKTDAQISIHNDSVFQIDDFKYSIDGLTKGNWARFMNHGDDGINVTAWEYFAEDAPRIIYTTNNKGVKKGQELLYSYGDSYWDEEIVEK